MIQIFHIANAVSEKLQEWKGNTIQDYRVFLRTNENMYAYILLKDDTNTNEISESISQIYQDCEIEFLSNDDLEDSFYQNIFEKPQSINIETGRRRFDTLLDTDKIAELPCSVATFYSYKGGMGRSTTLATFAMHLALHEGLNVVIIDCDFEAPGFTNFYLKNAGEENQKQGLVEYLLDKSTAQNKIELEKYTWEVDEKYRGKGSIRIMPAGNLDRSINTEDFLKTNLNHYIEGLARIDFVYEDYILAQFRELVTDLHSSFHTDIVLIDSRTGFGDIMGITAFHLSKFVVGFFRNDAQTLPGLHFFLDMVVKRDDIEPYIIHSILPQSLSLRRTLHNRFKEDVKEITDRLSDDAGFDFPCFPISRNENLEILGTTTENTDDLIELIQNKEIRDYKELFERLSDSIKNRISDRTIEEVYVKDDEQSVLVEEIAEKKNDILNAPPTLDDINKVSVEIQSIWAKEIQKKLLQATKDKLDKIDLYAENIDIEKEFRNRQFFFRNCMNDLFNLDKFLIIGSKGTGKSYIYSALKNQGIVNELKVRANKQDNYTFLYMIDKKDRIFRVNKFSHTTTTKRFQYRFWLIFTWQILIKEIKDYQTSALNMPLFEIRDDEAYQIPLEKCVADDNMIIAIEQDLKNLDAFLIAKGNGKKEYITAIYDQLDEMVEPSLWNEWLPSLIDFWRTKRYTRIFGKLFIRKDLFRKLMGITNIRDLENQAINIEWKPEEMYAYFFRIVLSQDMHDWFWAQMYLYKDYVPHFIKQVRPKYNNLEQMPFDEYHLRPLVATFFGKEVDVNRSTRMGESYEWFYLNLKSADDTINIRPFIELLKFAIENGIKNKFGEEAKPILYPLYYTDMNARKMAVNRHFEDLYRNEIGNIPLQYIFEYIDNHGEYQLITLFKSKFIQMLDNVIREEKSKQGMSGQTIDSLEQMLIVNGIVKKENFGRGDVYKFAYLYKYRLGLKGN